MTSYRPYVGRFAPTPSGPLHFGSIIAALASYLDARKHHGKWLLRIDDLDTPRVDPDSTIQILRTLEILQLEWDDEVIFQSKRIELYRNALDTLSNNFNIFRCYCPRKLTKKIPYPGTCRSNIIENQKQFSLRIETSNIPIMFTDMIQGIYTQNILNQSGDFIVQRSDKIFAYNLVAAIDDASFEITDVIRGADLLDTTPKQLYLQSLLNISSPHYGHLPIALNNHGKKLSKQHGATDILNQNKPIQIIINVLDFLGLSVEPGMEKSDIKNILSWAIESWDISRVPSTESIQLVDL